MTHTITILGSTGSIGRQTLQVARELGLSVAALTANRQVDLLEQQAREFHPALAVLYDRDAARELRLRLSDTDIRVEAGPEGLLLAAQLPQADTVVTAVMGSVGLEPTLAAIRRKKRIALANKETLVCAGELVMAEAERCGADIVPVDSEHSAIFQSLQGCRDRSEVRRLLLTCSGGPFFGRTRAELEHVTAAQALAHPTWNMGAKITVDSATLMNKGLERIEAMHLFGVDMDFIRVVIQRQSKIHSMVEYEDGSVIAHLGASDMRIPIQYAFSYPDRWETPAPRVDFRELGSLDFAAPDADAFRCLALAERAGRTGGTLPCVMNAANEVAVAAFLDGAIGFTDIDRVVEACMDAHAVEPVQTLEQLADVDASARDAARRAIRARR